METIHRLRGNSTRETRTPRLAIVLVLLVVACAFERMSYYGARSVSVVAMIQAGLEQQVAYQRYSWFVGAVGFSPLLGGLLAIGTGARIAAMVGAIVGSFGGAVLWFGAFDAGLVLLALGVGLVKPSLVGWLGLEARRLPVAAQLAAGIAFAAAINLGAAFAPMIVGPLAQSFGVRTGFVFATGIAMLTAINLLGARLAKTSEADPIVRGMPEAGAMIVVSFTVPAFLLGLVFARGWLEAARSAGIQWLGSIEVVVPIAVALLGVPILIVSAERSARWSKLAIVAASLSFGMVSATWLLLDQSMLSVAISAAITSFGEVTFFAATFVIIASVRPRFMALVAAVWSVIGGLVQMRPVLEWLPAGTATTVGLVLATGLTAGVLLLGRSVLETRFFGALPSKAA